MIERRKMWQSLTQSPRKLIASLCLISVVLVIFLQSSSYTPESGFEHLPASHNPVPASVNGKDQKLHVLLPTSGGDVNLCKLILSARALQYPDPVLVGWGEKYDTNYLLGGGSHIAKISKVLEWLNDRTPEEDQDLVLMMDAFDIWFQLRPETMIERYHNINKAANERIARTMGKAAAAAENIKQTIVFGAGKRCAPNQLHTIACYPIPDSPLPMDVYGAMTDTVIGRNKYTSQRQRFLNSGYIMGPVSDMRAMFEVAWKKAQAWPDHGPEDNGSHGSDFMYHGSDQAAFAVMYGEQEYQREVIRRRHSSWSDKAKTWSPKTGAAKQHLIEGTVIGDDILNPPWTHEKMNAVPGESYEFGMGLDYFSDLGHQTANAEPDGTWFRYNSSLEELMEVSRQYRTDFDCEYKGKGKLPADVSRSRAPHPIGEWPDIELYTNVCLDTIPVMIHYNGDKSARERMWHHLWSQPMMRGMVDYQRQQEQDMGVLAYRDRTLPWDEICPANFDKELYLL